MRALLSVYDKTGIVELAGKLQKLGFELLSTGGTFDAVEGAGLPVTPVSEITGFPEILDGRVKTLHPMIHGALLGRSDLPEHQIEMAEHGIVAIDLLVSNLYPFEQTVRTAGISVETAIEQIDIGGPAMLRAAAKNFANVIVISNPDDYQELLDRINRNETSLEWRRSLAAKAFAHTSAYDSLVSTWLRDQGGDDRFPDQITLAGRLSSTLRYGENPQQSAAVYQRLSPGATYPGLLGAKQVGGKELSYNNLLDADSAWTAVSRFDEPAVSIIKHTIPCGLAVRENLFDAYREALAGDPVSAFGGIVALTREVDRETAAAIAETFYEVILAPGYSDEAAAILTRKKNLRVMEMPPQTDAAPPLDVRSIQGGLLVQTPDVAFDDPATWQVVTETSPTEDQLRDLDFAWRVARSVKSNAIVLAKDRAIVGVGSGQPNRLESVAIAVKKAGNRAPGSVLASDAFFPFADGVQAAIEAGVVAVVQPGGSVRDDEVIEAANKRGFAMLFTGVRHFLH